MSLNAEFGEVWFFYPSIEDDTGEISRYVIYNYEENSWSIGSLVRYSWIDAGIEDTPIASGQASSVNYLYSHESGYNNDSSSMDNVFIESADIDVGDGDSFAFLKKVIPDIDFVNDAGTSQNGAVNFVLKRRDFPNQSLSTDSTLKLTSTTTYQSLRTRARQVVVRFESDDDNDDGDGNAFRDLYSHQTYPTGLGNITSSIGAVTVTTS